MQESQSPERASDIAIASAVAHAVRAVPGVVDLYPGDVERVATYGSGQRVDGIVVHHLAPDEIALEIHVALSETETKRVADAARALAEPAPESPGVLREVASHIRAAVYGIARDISPPALTRVDVLIDDLR